MSDHGARRPRVLTILPDIPLPPDSGLHLRMLGNLAVVRELGAQSFLLCFSTEERRENVDLLGEVRELVDHVSHAGERRAQTSFSGAEVARSKASFLLNGALGRKASTYPFAMRYDAVGGLDRAINEVKDVGADYVIIPSILIHWAPGLRASGVEVIADAADVLSDVTRRIAEQGTWRHPAQRLSRIANYLSSRTQEKRFFPECAEVWVTSPAEAQRVLAVSPGTRTVVMPNTVPVTSLPVTQAPTDPTIGFIGTYSYEPNLMAAKRLVRDIFPLVQQAIPEATVMLAGSRMPEEFEREMATTTGVDVLGRVEDSQRFFASCRVVALPIAVRGGIPLKVIEAMALRRPIVASPELIEGTAAQPGEDLLVGVSDEAFAKCIVELVTDRELAQRLGAAARLKYERYYSRDALVASARTSSVLWDR